MRYLYAIRKKKFLRLFRLAKKNFFLWRVGSQSPVQSLKTMIWKIYRIYALPYVSQPPHSPLFFLAKRNERKNFFCGY